MNIKIGDTLIKDASLTGSPSLTSPKVLGVSFHTDLTLDELADVFSAENAAQITLLDSNGNATKIFFNDKLTSLQIETLGGKRGVSAAFLVTPVDVPNVDSELKEKVATLEKELAVVKAENQTMNDALAAIEEGIANA